LHEVVGSTLKATGIPHCIGLLVNLVKLKLKKTERAFQILKGLAFEMKFRPSVKFFLNLFYIYFPCV
jgi:hypothetical protein